MSKIVCKINLGVMRQNVYIEGQKYSNKRTLECFPVELKDIPKFIVQQKDIKDVYVTGASKDYLQQLEKETKTLEYSLYNKDTKIFHYV